MRFLKFFTAPFSFLRYLTFAKMDYENGYHEEVIIMIITIVFMNIIDITKDALILLLNKGIRLSTLKRPRTQFPV